MRAFEEKIVFSLFSNAFKLTFMGEIIVSLRPIEADVELTVRDTETGIPAAELPRLFERFHRIRGAGLPARSRRVYAGGTVWGAGDRGRGTTGVAF